jgi:hypothetical protein
MVYLSQLVLVKHSGNVLLLKHNQLNQNSPLLKLQLRNQNKLMNQNRQASEEDGFQGHSNDNY